MRAPAPALALGAVLAAPLPALAQDAAPVDACARDWAVLVAVSGLGDVFNGPVTEVDGWCEARAVTLGDVPEGELGAEVRVDALRWRGEGLDALAAGTGLPTALEVEMEGLRVLTQAGDSTLTWLMERQQARSGIDGALSVAWDAGTRDLTVSRLDLDFPGEGAIALTATVAGLDLSSEAALTVSLGSAGLTRLTAEVALRGLFEAYLLMPLGAALLDGSPDPEAEAERLRARALAEVARLPEAIFPEPARAALSALLGDLPNPWGDLSVDVTASPPLGAPRLARFALTGAPATPEALWPALEGVTVAVEWAPSPPPG